MAGADPRFLEPQVKAAEGAGLKVVAAHLTGYEQPIPAGVSGVVPIDYKRAGALLADWAIWKTQTNVQAALTADPSINYVIPIYDVLTQWVVPAVTITGKSDKVKIASFNDTPFAIGLVQQGKVELDIGENLDWI